MDFEEMLVRLPGRVFGGKQFGDDADELELAALEEAASVFGPGVPLQVVPYYAIRWAYGEDAEVTGKRYYAYIAVMAGPPEQS